MDTTSNVLTRLLHCLAQHPDIQRKLRAEVVETFPDGELQYDRLLALPYMDAVCRETLRLCVLLHFLGGSSYVERSMIFRYTPSLWLGRTYGILFSSCSGTNYRDSAKRDTVLPLSRPVRRTDGRLSVELAVPANRGIHGCSWLQHQQGVLGRGRNGLEAGALAVPSAEVHHRRWYAKCHGIGVSPTALRI